MRAFGIACLLPLAACATVPAAGVPLTGQWGGAHIGLVLASTGGRLEYDCAAGTIGPVVPGAGGDFIATGTHTPAAGGPEVEGQVRPTYNVRFSGTVRGDVMRLQGAVANGVTLGPFELRRGAEAGIFRCL